MNVFCPRCDVIERTGKQQIGGKIMFGLVAAALGTLAPLPNVSFPWEEARTIARIHSRPQDGDTTVPSLKYEFGQVPPDAMHQTSGA
jgi:hypothetical protein